MPRHKPTTPSTRPTPTAPATPASDTEEDSNTIRPKHAGGRPPNPVWEHFEKHPLQSAGHFSAKCKYCTFFIPRGRPCELQIHLAKNCRLCPDDVRLKYLTIIVNENKDNDVESFESNKRCRQTTLDDHWDDEIEIPKSSKKRIDQAWVKAFVSCGIPFSAIENPYFVDAIKSLRSIYNPPSRRNLSETLLNYEVIKINSKVNNVLKDADNLTLGNN